jgi:epoxyqueuosine reductase
LHTQLLRREAERLGFSFVGIARAEKMDEEARRLEQWLHGGMHGSMTYMENYFEQRTDPRVLVPGAKSVVSLLFNYFPRQGQSDPEAPRLARYAFGEDYHFVLKRKLKALLDALREQIGDIQGRCFVDSAPVLERDWAKRAGNGWIGKNTLLIHPKAGSYFFLAELIIDLELIYDQPIRDFCGTCRRCIDACPTQAIAPEGYFMDGSKCISYFTIELRDKLPESYSGKFENWMFGCDICQEVCPWNRFSKPHEEPAFEPHPKLTDMTQSEWIDLSEEIFQQLFKRSAVKRTKFAGLKRNIQFLMTAPDNQQS